MTPQEVRAAVRAVVAALDPHWVEPPIVQSGALYLELLGEDVRRRALMLQSDDGAELCLRPDMTVPALRMARHDRQLSIVAYDGVVFRKQSAGSARESEFVQVGAEWIGARWSEADSPETEIVARALEGCRAVQVEPALKLGDASLVRAFVRACAVPDVWEGRVLRALSSANPAEHLSRLTQPTGVPLDALAEVAASLSPDKAKAMLEEVLSLGGITAVGGRSLEDIVARIQARAAGAGAARPSAEALALLADLVAIDAPLAEGVAAMERLLDRPALSRRDEAQRAAASVASRVAALGERVDLPVNTHFAPGLARGVAYYDGLVFELEHPPLGERASLGGGGRYDALVRRIVNDDAACGAGFVLRPARLALAREARS